MYGNKITCDVELEGTQSFNYYIWQNPEVNKI